MEIELRKKPYDRILFKKSTIELKSGLSIIIGHNGIGKTTLLSEIEKFCKSKQIPTFRYDNYSEGGSTAWQTYLGTNDFNSLSATAFHSEGEQIFYNFGEQLKRIGSFVGKVDKDKLFIMLDALDSGLDIDGIAQLLDICKIIETDCKLHKKEVYILLTANNYALIHKQNCFSISKMEYCTFDDFENYKKFIEDEYKKERKNVKC